MYIYIYIYIYLSIFNLYFKSKKYCVCKTNVFLVTKELLA